MRADPGPGGTSGTRPYTRRMRRWVCIVALLAGFSGTDYVRATRTRDSVAVVRLLEPRRSEHGLTPTGAWWSRSVH